MRAMVAGFAICTACVTDDVELATTELVTAWETAAWGTTSGPSYDLQMPPGWTCFLIGVGGNLSEGNETQSSYDFISSARIVGDVVSAHGGAYYSNGGQALANNPVKARVACVPRPSAGTATWQATTTTAAPPVFVAGPKSGRQCFLSEISGGGGRWSGASDHARVVFALGGGSGARYPQTGWYVESNEIVTGTARTDARVSAVCIDFPAGTPTTWGAFHGYPFGERSEWLTNGDAIKVCGLTEVQGAFTVNSYTDGVFIHEPSVPHGEWYMIVSQGKYGRAVCAW